ncbi:MAG: hypothetical protein ACO1OD_02805 [Croceibacterium sp.]
MSALDIGARGLAQRALQAFARTDENGASIAQRSAPTAAAFEALAAEYSLLTGEAGATYTFDTTAYPVRQQLLIRGNGAELRNVNETPSTSTMSQARCWRSASRWCGRRRISTIMPS